VQNNILSNFIKLEVETDSGINVAGPYSKSLFNHEEHEVHEGI